MAFRISGCSWRAEERHAMSLVLQLAALRQDISTEDYVLSTD
jgi:hypothetical protein